MDTTTLYGMFGWLHSQTTDARLPKKFGTLVQEKVTAYYDERLKLTTAESIEAFVRGLGEDLVAIDDEIKRVNRLIARGLEKNENYAYALTVLQDKVRAYAHTLDAGKGGAALLAFFGVRPAVEREVRLERTVRGAVRAETHDLSQRVAHAVDAAVREAVPEIARRAAAETVATLRTTPQRGAKGASTQAS
jgi:hypothetical protein